MRRNAQKLRKSLFIRCQKEDNRTILTRKPLDVGKRLSTSVASGMSWKEPIGLRFKEKV